MPELPEVETIRRQLEPKLIGQTISSIEILSPKSFCGDPKKIIGTKIVSLTRIGKQLSLNLSNNYLILAHFKMTGGLFFKPTKHTRIILHLSSPLVKGESPEGEGDFDKKLKIPLDKGGARRAGDLSRRINKSPPLVRLGGRGVLTKNNLPFVKGVPRECGGRDLYFNDLRKFGWLKLFTKKSLKTFQKHLGLDILSPDFTSKYFYTQLQSSSRPIKPFLLDQTKFAGIGNIYACESLFLSKINPLTPSKNISLPKAKKLHYNLQKIMSESILHGGSTARDKGYLLPDGASGTHQDHFLVYQKENQKCLICGAKIKRIKQGGRSTFYCEKCQKKT